MMRNKLFLACAFSLWLAFSWAQQTKVYTDPLANYYKAKALYESKQYLAAQQLFSETFEQTENPSLQGDCMYYIANCAVRLNQQDADFLMEEFVREFPTSTKRNEAFLDVAEYYFNNGKYARAKKWYEKVAIKSMTLKQRESYNFNLGYAYFFSKQYPKAQQYFNRISASQTYGAQAKYYLGYMAYEADDYAKASTLFDAVKGDARFQEGLSYYEADMNFKLGNFQKAIDLGLAQWDTSRAIEKSELAKIIGESYFNLKQYQEAIPYLQAYKGKRGKWNNTDYYLLGYANYKIGAYPQAIQEFNKIINGNNQVAQNAYYHLAEAYLKQNQKTDDLNEFKNASEMPFNKSIEEDALLNYAKLSYELGNSYESTPAILQGFIKKYPRNDAVPQIRGLLVNAYVAVQDYEAALNLLEKEKTNASKATYQKVAYLRGADLYSKNNYQEALTFFEKALNYKVNNTLVAKTLYWKANSLYHLNRYQDAERAFLEFNNNAQAVYTNEYSLVDYNLGYSRFKQKKYTAALTSFTNYIESANNTTHQQDAYARMGDCAFVNKNYWPAMEYYNKALAINKKAADYLQYQKALSYGFVDRIPQKISNLKDFSLQFPKSFLQDDAIYELANTYLSQDNTTQALQQYTRLETAFPASPFVPQALLKKALIYDNEGNSNKALEIFKKVAQKYKGTEAAIQAVASAKLIYIDLGQVQDYAQWVATLDFVEVADAELDAAAYQAAETPYLEQRKEVARTRFKSYLSQFPSGQKALQAHFYLSQIALEKENLEAAKIHLDYVLEQPTNTFTEQALLNRSELFLKANNFNAAMPLLLRLEQASNSQQNTLYAISNLMKAHYQNKDYVQAVQYADKVLNTTDLDNVIKSDAQIIVARAAFQTKDFSKAEKAYATLENIATGKLAAEALYYKAYFLNARKEFKASNNAVQQLAKDYAAHKEFGARGLLLMALNFEGLGDLYQATYILESVVTNFASYEDISTQAQTELNRIKKEAAKTNASVETTDGNE